MRQLSDILRLKYQAGVSQSKIAAAVGRSKGVVNKYISLAEAHGVSWPLPEGMDEAALERLLFPGSVDPERRLKYTDFLDMYGKLTPEEEAEYRRRYPQENEAMTGYFQQIREQAEQKGVQEGMQQGMERGMQQGEAVLLLRQLERKFGAEAAADHRARIEQADTDTLLEWSERILTAQTIDDVIH